MIITPHPSQWQGMAGETGIQVLGPIDQGIEDFIAWWQAESDQRIPKLKGLADMEQRKVRTSLEPVVIVVDDLDMLYDQLPDAMIKLLTGLCASPTAYKFNVYLLFSLSIASLPKMRIKSLVTSISQRQTGMVLGGKLSDCDVFTTQLDYVERNQALPEGQGYVIDAGVARRVVLVEA